LERDLPPDVRRQLTMAHKSAKSLLGLISDILDLSRLQSGGMVLEPVRFDLRAQLRACVDLMRERAPKRT
ncbi:histidine kinase dimerization/phospho-acceptor domain-containing protein, partial [Azospirillum sp. B4]|uniref:sensor histidine kinase n=1 Tax=Azospirillum sp. B4 TaxID=95605 RepID=UPI0005C84163